jgi:hypothetical protein
MANTEGRPGKVYTEVSAAVYEQMWEVYRDGLRTQSELIKHFGVHVSTARRAINDGWVDRGFQALRARAQDHDRMRADAQRKVEEEKLREQTDAWYKAGKQFNRVADNSIAFAIAALQQVQNLVMVRGADGRISMRPLTRWVRKRDVSMVEGKRVVRVYDEEVPLSIAEGVKLNEQVMRGVAMASAFKKLWPLTTDEERAKTGEPEGLAALTVEQLRHIVETGQLPDGVSGEDVFGVSVPGMGGKPGRKANN